MHGLKGLGVVIGLGALLSGAPAAGQPEGHGPPPAPVVLDEARMESTEQLREVTGLLRALKRSLLASQEEGLVVSLGFEEGDEVKAGDTIAKLHDVRAKIGLARAEADVAAHKATVAERTAAVEMAQRDWQRYEQASGKATVAAMEMDRMRSALDVESARLDAAKAELASAESDLGMARQSLDDMTIRAPFDGRLVSRRTQVGQWLGRGDAVVEIVALDTIEAWIDVPERYIGRLSASGGTVQIRCAAVGRTVEAAVTAVIPDADPLSKLFPVRVRLDNKDLVYKPGMSVVGLVPTGSAAPTLTVSKDAVLRDDAGEYVYFNGGGHAAVARITTLFGLSNSRLAIRSDSLPPGAGVVVEGNERLFPGQPLAIQGGPGAAPPSAPAGSAGGDSGVEGH